MTDMFDRVETALDDFTATAEHLHWGCTTA